MEFEYPLILVAKKEFLESFQNGYLYLVNSLHYQQMENEDPNRGDKYDGAIMVCDDSGVVMIPKDKIDEKLITKLEFIEYHLAKQVSIALGAQELCEDCERSVLAQRAEEIVSGILAGENL